MQPVYKEPNKIEEVMVLEKMSTINLKAMHLLPAFRSLVMAIVAITSRTKKP